MTFGGGADKAGRSVQILPKAFPFAIPTLNIWIGPITIHATSANGIFLEVEDLGIRHAVHNLSHRPDDSTIGADQRLDSLSSLSSHDLKLQFSTDKNLRITE